MHLSASGTPVRRGSKFVRVHVRGDPVELRSSLAPLLMQTVLAVVDLSFQSVVRVINFRQFSIGKSLHLVRYPYELVRMPFPYFCFPGTLQLFSGERDWDLLKQHMLPKRLPHCCRAPTTDYGWHGPPTFLTKTAE